MVHSLVDATIEEFCGGNPNSANWYRNPVRWLPRDARWYIAANKLELSANI
jgi:hypothetical protein